MPQAPALSAVLLAAALLLQAGMSRASDLAAAEALFNEGRALLQAGQTELACQKFEESERLDASAGTALNLARCYELLGRTASAWASYQVAERLATTQGRSEVAVEAGKKAAELGPLLGSLTLVVVEPVPELQVQVADTTLASGALGSKIPFDPGTYTVRVSAPGHRAYETEVSVANGRDTNVTIPKLIPVSAAPVATPPREAPPPPPRERRPAPQGDERTRAYLIGGGGVVLLGGSVLLGFLAKSKNDEARDLCGGRTSDCPSATMDRADAASSLANAGTVVGTIGILGIGAGAALLFTADAHDADVDRALRPWSLAVGSESASLRFSGDFE